MNTKKILMRTLPLAIIILAIVAVAVVCSVVPKNVSQAKLSKKYAGNDFLTVGDIKISNQDAYELLAKSYGASTLVELVDTYLVENTNAGDTSYLAKAKADADGLDKWISDAIFSSGRKVDALDDDATDEEKEEAAKSDNETIASWYDTTMSTNNVSTVKEIKDIYAYQYAKYLYTLDYLMDNTVYTFGSDTFTVMNKYLSFAINYGNDTLELSKDKLASLEKDVYATRDEFAKKLFDLVNVEYEETKIKGTYSAKKIKTINEESLSHVTFAKRVESRDVNTKDDIEKIFAVKEQFLSAICEKLNAYGASFANVDAMVDDDSAPNITTSYASKFEADYADEYWAMYVKFSSTTERDNALAQLNVKIVDYTWVKLDAYDTAYEEAMAVEGTEEADAKTTAIEASKLNDEEVLSFMVKLYNNYNSKYVLEEGTNKLVRQDAIDETNLGYLNDLINVLLVNGLYDEESGLNTNGSKFDIETLNEEDTLAKYEFLSKFHYTYSELADVSSSFQTLIYSTLKQGLAAYKVTNGSEFDLNKVYGPTSTANSTIVALKLGYSSAKCYKQAWDDLTAAEQQEKSIEYIADGAKDSYATSKTTTAFNELRIEKGLIIYDQDYEDSYINSVDSSFEETKKKSKTLVAKIGELELTADMLFEKLGTAHGLVNVMTLYEQDYFIYSEWSRLNEVYDSAKGKWLEKTDTYKEVISEPLKNAQSTYDYYNAYYLQYGAGTMTWEEFLSLVYGGYGVHTTDDLKMYFVYQDAEERYSKRYEQLGSYENNTLTINKIYTGSIANDNLALDVTNGNESLWDVLMASKIQEIDNKNDWFSVAGWHVLVCVKDASGNTVDPKEWTDAQIFYAEKLYAKIVAMFPDYEGNDDRQDAVKAIISAWGNYPILNNDDLAYTEEGEIDLTKQLHNDKLTDASYEYAVYKTLGLSLVCEDISAISPSNADNYDSAFVDAVKACYPVLILNNDGEEETQTDLSAVYGVDVPFANTAYENANGDKFVRGAFGYHIYVATSVTTYGKYTVSGLDDVKLDYTLDYLSPEVITYLARTDKYARIDDELLALLPEDHEFNKVFKDWYSGSYSYDGVFAELVEQVRGKSKVDLGKITDPASETSLNYYDEAAANCGSNDRLKYAQKTYLFDLLTSYVKANMTKFYTPVLEDIDGTNTKYGLSYTLFIKELSAKSFTFDSNFNLVKDVDLTDDTNKIYFVDEDGNKTELVYADRDGLNSSQFIFKYMLETVTKDLTYAKEFTCKLVGVTYDEEE